MNLVPRAIPLVLDIGNFAIGDVLCFAGTKFCYYDRLFFSQRIIIFCNFQKVPNTHVDKIFVFVEYVRAIEIQIFKQYYGVRTLCKTSISLECIPLCF